MEEIKKLLEAERDKLDTLVLLKGSASAAVLEQSRRLDHIIEVYMRQGFKGRRGAGAKEESVNCTESAGQGAERNGSLYE